MNTKSPLQAKAYEHLKELILSGALDASTLYSETKMATQLGVSRTPMREALQCLSQDGYIYVIPSKGFRIRQLNEKDMIESIQVRCAIEGFCVHQLSANIHTEKGSLLLEKLGKILTEQEMAVSRDDSLKSFMELDHQFHLAIIEYVDNHDFNQLFQRLMYMIHLTTTGALSVPGRVDETLEEHRQFFAYLKDGNGDAAYKLLINHLLMPLNMHLTGEKKDNED